METILAFISLVHLEAMITTQKVEYSLLTAVHCTLSLGAFIIDQRRQNSHRPP